MRAAVRMITTYCLVLLGLIMQLNFLLRSLKGRFALFTKCSTQELDMKQLRRQSQAGRL